MSPALISLDQINEALADRLEDLLPELIGGHAAKGEWIASSTRDGGLGDSLTVALRAGKRGKWYHHAAGVGGDPLGLIAYARFNNDMKRAFAWARDFLGGKIEAETEKDRERRLQRMANARRKEERETRANIGRARYWFFQLAQPLVSEDGDRSPAWHYLNNRLTGRLEQLGHLPGCLKFMPELVNYQLFDNKLPALVAGAVDVHGDQVALHQTWLVKRGATDDTWDRLRADDYGRTADGKELKGKKFLGPFKGCTIRLWPGNRTHAETGEVKRGVGWPKLGPGSSIMLAEGIETGLSLALAMPERRIVCTGSIEGFVNVELPPCFSKVTIAADRDPDNKAAAGALERAKLAHAQAGRHCSVVYPPEGTDDWNTALKQAAARVA
jgi:hypothetical protein